MTTYGTTPAGFSRKPLAVILDEIEQRNIEIFGPGLIQTPQSPMGQLNALRAEFIAMGWEIGEITYQSYDPDQAEGLRLDMLSRLRLVERSPGEDDASLALAITNAGRAAISNADFYRAIRNLDGVTWAKIHTNETNQVDEHGLEPHSVSVAVLGGDDEEIATTARGFIVPGISSSGNTRVETTIDGFCRTIYITRPSLIPVTVHIDLYKGRDTFGCPPPSTEALVERLVANLTGDNLPDNDADVTRHMIQMAISCDFPAVEVVEVRAARGSAVPVVAPLAIGFYEIAAFSVDRVVVNVL